MWSSHVKQHKVKCSLAGQRRLHTCRQCHLALVGRLRTCCHSLKFSYRAAGIKGTRRRLPEPIGITSLDRSTSKACEPEAKSCKKSSPDGGVALRFCAADGSSVRQKSDLMEDGRLERNAADNCEALRSIEELKRSSVASSKRSNASYWLPRSFAPSFPGSLVQLSYDPFILAVLAVLSIRGFLAVSLVKQCF